MSHVQPRLKYLWEEGSKSMAIGLLVLMIICGQFQTLLISEYCKLNVDSFLFVLIRKHFKVMPSVLIFTLRTNLRGAFLPVVLLGNVEFSRLQIRITSGIYCTALHYNDAIRQ